MPIKLQCPQCGTVAGAPDAEAGRYVRCKRCHVKFPLPPGVPTLPVAPSEIGRSLSPPVIPAVIDRYQLRELLGEGAFGCVYRAFDPRLEREVALKVLHPAMMRSTQAVERFLREARASAKLHHPHIVPVHDADHSGSVYYIASAFIKGTTLASAIPENGVEPRQAVEWTAQLASALGYAHRQGILHRDVKPANAMLDEEGSLHLMDFGLAGWTQDESTRLTRVGAVMGTPAYMAPEQASGDTKRVGPLSDLYSAGVVLYELLTGHLPFEGGHPGATGYLIVHTEPMPPSQHRPDLDAGLEALCLKAMAKKPEDRFASGEEMAAALTKWAPMALPVAPAMPTVPPILSTKATIDPLPSWLDKKTIIPSSESLPAGPKTVIARRPSVFDWETVVSVAKRSTLETGEAKRAEPVVTSLPVKDRRWSWRTGPPQSPDTRLFLWSAVIVGTALTLAVGVVSFSAINFAHRQSESPKSAPSQECQTPPLPSPMPVIIPHEIEPNPPVAPPPDFPPMAPSPMPVISPMTEANPPVTPPLVIPPVTKLDDPPVTLPPVIPPVKQAEAVPEAQLPDDITNLGIHLKLIKPGKFLMGSPMNEEGHSYNEWPQHEVEITRAFYMGANPVTRGQFAAFVNDSGYKTEAETVGLGLGYNASKRTFEGGAYTWRALGFTQTDEHPVVEVTWNDAVKYCEWLSEKEHKTYELPTEAEWEYACRAGTTTRFWCGDRDEDLQGNANIGDASFKAKYPNGSWAVSWDDGYPFTSPVGKFKANRWGLYDMHGNVWQWCSDVYGEYKEGYIKDPKSANNGPRRVLRGGSWSVGPRSCRSAYRLNVLANRYDFIGFRVVLRIPPRTP